MIVDYMRECEQLPLTMQQQLNRMSQTCLVLQQFCLDSVVAIGLLLHLKTAVQSMPCKSHGLFQLNYDAMTRYHSMVTVQRAWTEPICAPDKVQALCTAQANERKVRQLQKELCHQGDRMRDVMAEADLLRQRLADQNVSLSSHRHAAVDNPRSTYSQPNLTANTKASAKVTLACELDCTAPLCPHREHQQPSSISQWLHDEPSSQLVYDVPM